VAPKWLKQANSSGFDVVAVQLPGRGNRRDEKPITNVLKLISELIDPFEKMIKLEQRNYCLFGHSMGSLVAFELAREILKRNQIQQPTHLFVSSRIAPQLKTPEYFKRSKIEMIEVLKWMGGTPPDIFNDQTMLDNLLELVFADFTLNETYDEEFRTNQLKTMKPFTFPITAIKGTNDNNDITLDFVGQWKIHSEKFELKENEGGHFHAIDNPTGLFEIIQKSYNSQ